MLAAPVAESAAAAADPPMSHAPAAFGPSSVLTLVRRFFRVGWTFFWVTILWLGEVVGFRRVVRRLGGGRVAAERVNGPVAWRRAFEALGPTYVKLGQIIASGDGLFPIRYSEEFRKCLDRVPPFAFEHVEATIEHELGRPGREIFASIKPKPIAAASIAQVHLATLDGGEEVVIKVQRPGLEPILRADVALMRLFAKVLAAVVPHLELANPVGIIEDLATTLAEELDFRREAQHMRAFNATLARAGNTGVAAPRVKDELTTRRLLTMERFVGVRVDDTAAVLASDFDAQGKLLAGIRGWFQTLLLGGFFHGDVHAGNFMLLDDGRVGFLDFGIVGRFDARQKGLILDYVIAFHQRDYGRLTDVFVQMGSIEEGSVDRARFTRDIEAAFAPMVDAADGFKIRDIVPDMMRVAVRHRMRMPREFVLVTKQLVYLDRYAKAIGGPTMNVLTDPRVLAFLMADVAAFG
jgi:predicted unusual protein kinase regulating ubiquinone biosynthesis (AarF/ABC1/UbiB family)